MTESNNDDLKQLIESNARAIQSLADALVEWRRDSQREIAALRETVADLVRNQGEISANTYRLINRLDNRQGEIVEILKLLVDKKRAGDEN